MAAFHDALVSLTDEVNRNRRGSAKTVAGFQVSLALPPAGRCRTNRKRVKGRRHGCVWSARRVLWFRVAGAVGLGLGLDNRWGVRANSAHELMEGYETPPPP